MTFPDGIVWQGETFPELDRVAAVREALSGHLFAVYTPEQRADALQAAISFDIHCKPQTVITPVCCAGRIEIELRTGTHLTTGEHRQLRFYASRETQVNIPVIHKVLAYVQASVYIKCVPGERDKEPTKCKPPPLLKSSKLTPKPFEFSAPLTPRECARHKLAV